MVLRPGRRAEEPYRARRSGGQVAFEQGDDCFAEFDDWAGENLRLTAGEHTFIASEACLRIRREFAT
jgi:hypothetical protein